MNTCRWPDSCPDRAGDSGYCRTHYIRAYRAGHLTVKHLDDPGPLRAYMTAWTARGRRLATLAEIAGVNPRALTDLAADRVHKARPGLTQTVLNVPLPPSDVGTLRRIRALAVRGYTLANITTETGGTVSGLSKSVHRQQFADPVAYAIAHYYTRRILRPGPSKEVTRRALRDGFEHPYAWHNRDIDNPHTKPNPIPLGPAPLTLHNAWTRARELQRLPNNWGTARGLRMREAA